MTTSKSVTGLRVTTASSETPLRQLATLVRNLTSQSTILPVVSQQLAAINLHLGGIRIDGANQRYEVTRFRR